ncbi:MAG TPA: hypothetical protein VGF59_26035 [Bryobacteraceae bacterium]|jgi:hypothetical protein
MAPVSAPACGSRERIEDRLCREVQTALRELPHTAPDSPDRKAALTRLNAAVERLNALILDHALPEE